MKCRICDDVKRPSSNSVKSAQVQLLQLRQIIQQLKFKKEELNHEIEVKFGDDNYIDNSKEIYFSAKYNQLSQKIKKKNYEREKQILDITERTIILQSKRAELEALKAERNALKSKLADKRIVHECLVLSQQSDLIQDLNLARWRKVLHLFIQFHLECPPPATEDTAENKRSKVKLTGISSILNLPLPNSGNYQDIPVEVVASALSHISHLVNSLSLILNIPLPHPLLPFDTFESAIIRSQGNLMKHVALIPAFQSLSEAISHPPSISCPPINSQSSNRERSSSSYRDRNGNISDVLAVLSPVTELELLSSSDSGDLQPIKKTELHSTSREKEPLRFLYLPKSQRSCPALSSKSQSLLYPHSEEEEEASIECLNERTTIQPSEEIENLEFQFGLSLLQANILVLCIKSGIDPQTLYPPEALLLNLDILQQFTIKYLSSSNDFTQSPMNDLPNVVTLPQSLQRLIDPYPSLDPEQDLPPSQRNNDFDVDDGIYIFENGEDEEILHGDGEVAEDEEVDFESFNHAPLHEIRSHDHIISSPMREFEEKAEDSYEWAFIDDSEDIIEEPFHHRQHHLDSPMISPHDFT